MNKQGQVFLLMTILTITFMMTISTILLDVQRAEYFEPAPDNDKILEAWEVAVSSIEQSLSLYISINTQAGAASGNFNNEIDTQFTNIENYMNSRGLSASIKRSGNAAYTAPVGGLATDEARLTTTVYLSLTSAGGITIEQTINVDIRYQATIVGGVLTILKNINGEITYIPYATITPPGGGSAVDNSNGSYTLVGAGTYAIVTPDQVVISVVL